MSLDVESMIQRVNEFLGSLGFFPRDADSSDLQRGSDRSIRFKTGTAYGEVTVVILEYGKPNEVLRVLQPSHAGLVLARIEDRVIRHGGAS